MKNSRLIDKKIDQALRQASFILRDDVIRLIKKAYRTQTNKRAKQALGWIIENANIAKEQGLALCQDTGFGIVFIEAGKNISLSSSLIERIKTSLEKAYQRNYLRKSLVDPLGRLKPGYKGIATHIEFNPKASGLKLTLFAKGFGSENKTRLRMFKPTAALREIEDFVVETVRQAGPQACPPFIVGIGMGSTSDGALLLAKKALCGEIDTPNRDRSLRALERKLLKRINSLKIGPMGFGGGTTALGVKIMKQPTHIAGLPVGVNVSCWALRSATVKLTS